MLGLPKELPYTGRNISRAELALIKTNIAGYFFDGFIDVSHSINTQVTTHQVQKGVSVSDHAYLEPVEVTMTIKMSDAAFFYRCYCFFPPFLTVEMLSAKFVRLRSVADDICDI